MDTITTYTVTRDTAHDNATDEDRGMAHVNYGTFDTLDDARAELVRRAIAEVAWLRLRPYNSARGDERAAEIERHIPAMVTLRPDTNPSAVWERQSVIAAGLRFAIVRIERLAQAN